MAGEEGEAGPASAGDCYVQEERERNGRRLTEGGKKRKKGKSDISVSKINARCASPHIEGETPLVLGGKKRKQR